MKNKPLRNIAYNSIYRIVVILTPLITSPYLSRVLGAEKLGIYSYCYAFAIYFAIVPMLGVNDYGNRTIAQHRNSDFEISDNFWQIFYIQFFLTCISSLAYLMTIILSANDHSAVRMVLLLYVITSAIDINWFAFGLEEFRFISIRNILIRLGTLICIFTFVHDKDDLLLYALIITVGNLISVIPVWFLVLKHTRFCKPNIKKILVHLKCDLILFLPVIAATVYQQIDKLMLGNAGLTLEVGFYQNAENIVTLPTFVTNAIVTVMLPYISNIVYTSGDTKKTVEIIYDTCHYASIINIAMMFGMIGISSSFIPWYLGDGYERSAELLVLISPTIVINGISSIIRYEYLIPYEKDTAFTLSIVIGATLNVVLNTILIPAFYANGAAIATVLSYSLVLVIQIISSYKVISYKMIFTRQIPYLCIGVIMTVLIYFLENTLYLRNIYKIPIEILIGGGFYVIFTYIVMHITHDKFITIIKNMKVK